MLLLLSLLSLLLHPTVPTTIKWPGVPSSPTSASSNTETLNTALQNLEPNMTLILGSPNTTYWLAGGVYAEGLKNVTIQLDGTLKFQEGREGWPTEDCSKGTCVKKAIYITTSSNLLLTSSSPSGGTVDGSGAPWWGYANYLLHGEDRPKLFTLYNGTDVTVENWHFRQSAYHTFHADDCARVTVRGCTVDNRANGQDGHGPANLAALNTDGFDVSGRDIHIHDCKVWNQDDCFTIVPLTAAAINSKCTENVLVENVEASGLGLTVGSIKPAKDHACIKVRGF